MYVPRSVIVTLYAVSMTITPNLALSQQSKKLSPVEQCIEDIIKERGQSVTPDVWNILKKHCERTISEELGGDNCSVSEPPLMSSYRKDNYLG